MRALTLHGCHAWAVAHGGKNVENRGWEIPAKHIGTTIAIHAGVNPGSERAQAYVRNNVDAARSIHVWPRSAVVATARLLGCVSDDGVLGKLTAAQAERARSSDWWIGPYGWVLSDVRALRAPLPCKGALGLWELPSDVTLALLGRG